MHPTRYEDANNAPGPVLLAGSTVVWTYLVSNPGTTPIDVIGVQDDNGTGVADRGFVVDPVVVVGGHVAGDTNENGLLDPGETWLFRATGSVPLGAYLNTATVTGVVVAANPSTRKLKASDLANLFGTRGGIEVQKFLRGIRSTDPATPVLVAAGKPATWTYAVRNTEATPLANVVLVDDNGTPANAADDLTPTPVLATGYGNNVGDANRDGLLDPTETWLYRLDRIDGLRPVRQRRAGPRRPDDEHRHGHGLGRRPALLARGDAEITVVKAVNAYDPFRPTPVEDANSQPAKELLVGSTATWTYVVRNTGNVAVVMSTIRDDNGTPTNVADDFTPVPVLAAGTAYNVGDLNRNGLLDIAEAWLFSATTVVRAAPTSTPRGRRSNEPVTAQKASASDVAGYYGNGYAEGLTPGYWKNHTSSWPTWSDGSQVWRTNQLVGSVFTAAPAPNRSMTLFDALNDGGGNVEALLRHAVSALLSTGSQFISYPVSARWIVDQVNAALASGDPTRIENLKNQPRRLEPARGQRHAPHGDADAARGDDLTHADLDTDGHVVDGEHRGGDGSGPVGGRRGAERPALAGRERSWSPTCRPECSPDHRRRHLHRPSRRRVRVVHLDIGLTLHDERAVETSSRRTARSPTDAWTCSPCVLHELGHLLGLANEDAARAA